MKRRDGSKRRNSKQVKKLKPIQKEKWTLGRLFKDNNFTYIDDIAMERKKTNKGTNGFKVSALSAALLFMYLRGIESILDLIKFLEKHLE
jgi:hypothetical protein